MATLILASVATNIISQATHLFKRSFAETTLGVVSAAAMCDRRWIANELSSLENFGFVTREIALEGKTPDALSEQCRGIDALFVMGGNTFYLLHHVRQSGFDKIIAELLEGGVVYIGSSAGALLACPSIETAVGFDDHKIVPLTDYTGLSLVPFVPMVHINVVADDAKNKAVRDANRAKAMPDLLIGLTDYQAVSVVDGYIEFLGMDASPAATHGKSLQISCRPAESGASRCQSARPERIEAAPARAILLMIVAHLREMAEAAGDKAATSRAVLALSFLR